MLVKARTVIGVLSVAAVFALGWHFGGLGPEAELAELRADAARTVAAAQIQARATETEWAARAAAVESNYESKRQALAADLATARSDSERLRRAITAYTDRPAAPAGAACPVDERANALGTLLAELEQLASESAAAADAEGERVRAWQAWAESIR